MALATKCPHCNTIFRVAADQLKLRGGIVRCGTCKEVFDGNAALVDPAAALPFLPSAPAFLAPAASAVHDEPIYSLDFDTSFDPFGILPDAAQIEEDAEKIELDLDIGDELPVSAPAPVTGIKTEAAPEPEPLPVPMAPFKRRQVDEAPAFATYLRSSRPQAEADETVQAPVTVAAIAAPVEPEQESAAEPETALEPIFIAAASARQEPVLGEHAPLLQPQEPVFEPVFEPISATPADITADEPAFVTQGRRREQSGKAMRVAMAVGSVLLLLLLLLQGMTTFRNPLAAQFPELKPALLAVCSLSGCKVDLPAQIEALSVEQGELQTLAPNTFSYVSLLRNQSRNVQAWPSIELILNDGNDKPVVRRVIGPRDYLPAGAEVAKGFAARSEQSIKLYFSLDQLTAAGYHIAIFYP
ncbi:MULTISPECIES: DUF3426 domain-containing protein [unclassified Janthinobacterium]|uniref:DUF3426 domain-containing protein n=1 Tax=unclassified Janthinobacterium TaxID=2610881 RepID=UPI0016102CF4|nr:MULTISPECIES: DUF3426 domain-containing protein [unclassified Janthinobacterium]